VQLPENATPPEPLDGNPQPAYPEAARAQALRATVIVKLGIGEDGRVVSAEVLRGHPLFDDEVLRAVRQWRFRPARLPSGEPIAVFKVLPIRFQVE
jgi:protein TonB